MKLANGLTIAALSLFAANAFAQGKPAPKAPAKVAAPKTILCKLADATEKQLTEEECKKEGGSKVETKK